MESLLREKYDKLKSYFKALGNAAVAFSSGVDSTLMLKVAHDVLGDKAVAVTASSSVFPQRELTEGSLFCKQENIRHITVEVNQLEEPQFTANPKNRCYVCKKYIFERLLNIAQNNGLTNVCEGSNVDDTKDYRPGMQAIKELGIKSPLLECGLTKAEIRELSEVLGLTTARKSSFACLATRIPYGEEITKDKLSVVEKGEQLLFDLGFKQFRLRLHGSFLARIEVPVENFEKLMEVRETIVRKFESIGIKYVTLDLEGFKSGSMNKVLNAD